MSKGSKKVAKSSTIGRVQRQGARPNAKTDKGITSKEVDYYTNVSGQSWTLARLPGANLGGPPLVSERAVEASEAAKTWREIHRCLENVELARKRMANDQIEIDRLRTETRALISEMLP